MITETEIRRKLVALLERRVSLAQFQDWLVEQSWNMHKDSSAEAQQLVSEIELALSEYSNRHLAESELHQKLWAALHQIAVAVQINDDASVVPARRQVVTAASAVPQERWATVPALA